MRRITKAAIVGVKLLNFGGTFLLWLIFLVKIAVRMICYDSPCSRPLSIATNLTHEAVTSSGVGDGSPRWNR